MYFLQERGKNSKNAKPPAPAMPVLSANAAILRKPDTQTKKNCSCGGVCPRCKNREAAMAVEAEPDFGKNNALFKPVASLNPYQFFNDEPVPPPEYNAGETQCNRETGEMETTIFNTKCTRVCTAEHEADHRAYRGDCCRRYSIARQAAIDAGNLEERNRISRRYIEWQNATSDYSECRADRISVTCGNRIRGENGCSTITDENRECCSDIDTYVSAAERRVESECPGTNQDCPF